MIHKTTVTFFNVLLEKMIHDTYNYLNFISKIKYIDNEVALIDAYFKRDD